MVSSGSSGPPGPASERVRVRRRAKRGSYDRQSLDEIFDEALVCRVGFVDDGQPFVLPTSFLRHGDAVYVHGHQRNRMLGRVASGAPVAIEATIVDSMSMGRAVFSHSMNYRTAVVLGTGHEVVDPDEKTDLMNRLVERLLPGRLDTLRPLSEKEVGVTRVVAVPITEFSVKARTGPPVDALTSDRSWPAWAGTLPLHIEVGVPEPDEYVPADMPAPDYLLKWSESRTGV